MNARCLVLGLLLLFSRGTLAQTSGGLVHEGIISAPIETVWASWTTGDGLQSWLAPHVEIEFQIGGKMRTNYNPNGSLDDPQTIENTILSYDPHRMISLKVSKAPEGFPFPNAVYGMWTVMYFEPVAPEQTLVRVVAHGFSSDEESQRMRAFFEQGNAATIRHMQVRIGKRQR